MLSQINWKRVLNLSFATLITCGLLLTGCGGNRSDRAPKALAPVSAVRPAQLPSNLTEVSPPDTLQTLNQVLERYQPQVKILSPQPGEVLDTRQVSVKFQVKDLPIFKDEKLGIGPHLDVVLDDQPSRTVYDLNQPLVLSDLDPGTHTLRVFASRPWHESFKNEGSFAQVTFHLFTQTNNNNPSPGLPLLTYNAPAGELGGEPVLLDFYLSNAPLRLANDGGTSIDGDDWRIRCTINGQSFILDRWQPLYLKGFKPGKNWVRLELINAQGQLIENAFNDTVQVFDYNPDGQDTLSRLVRGDLKLAKAKSLILPGYEAIEEPEPPLPEVSAPVVEPVPEFQATPTPEIPAIAPLPTPDAGISAEPVTSPEPTVEVSPVSEGSDNEPTEVDSKPAPQKSKGGFFSRFTAPKVMPTGQPTAKPTTEPTVTPTPVLETPSEVTTEPVETKDTVGDIQRDEETVPTKPEAPKARGSFFSRFVTPQSTPTAAPAEPNTVDLNPVTDDASPPAIATPPASVETVPVATPAPALTEDSAVPEKQPKQGWRSFFSRSRSTPTPERSSPESTEATPATSPTLNPAVTPGAESSAESTLDSGTVTTELNTEERVSQPETSATTPQDTSDKSLPLPTQGWGQKFFNSRFGRPQSVEAPTAEVSPATTVEPSPAPVVDSPPATSPTSFQSILKSEATESNTEALPSPAPESTPDAVSPAQPSFGRVVRRRKAVEVNPTPASTPTTDVAVPSGVSS